MNEQEFNDKVKSYIQKATARGTPKSVQAKFIADRKAEFQKSLTGENDRYEYKTIGDRLVRIDNTNGEVTEVYKPDSDEKSLSDLENLVSLDNQMSPDQIPTTQTQDTSGNAFNINKAPDPGQTTSQLMIGNKPLKTDGLSFQSGVNEWGIPGLSKVSTPQTMIQLKPANVQHVPSYALPFDLSSPQGLSAMTR